MRELSHEYCLKLFFRCAFGEVEQRQWPVLRKIGEEIVMECRGVPLALMTLGRLLRFKTDESEWKSVRDNEIWRLRQKEDDIMSILKLSYERLPSHLKPCFAHCSIFPKDFEFFDFQLTGLWMALDLLKPSYAHQDLEDVGRSYFNELATRGFFQDVEVGAVAKVCKMRDLVHDLALLVAGDELFNTASNKELPDPQKIWYLYSGNLDDEPAPLDPVAFLQSLKHIRAAYFESGTNYSFIETCLPKFRYLLFLHCSYVDFNMPRKKVFSNSQHLRYLSLRFNKELRRLPSSICELHSLQYLDLSLCENFEELPEKIKYLVSLRILHVTLKQVCLPNDGIGALKSLRSLQLVCCENMEHLFEDIQGLRNLRQLWILSCPTLKCFPQGVKYLFALEELFIAECDNIDLGLKDGESDRDIASYGIRILMLDGLPKLEEILQWLLQRSA